MESSRRTTGASFFPNTPTFIGKRDLYRAVSGATPSGGACSVPLLDIEHTRGSCPERETVKLPPSWNGSVRVANGPEPLARRCRSYLFDHALMSVAASNASSSRHSHAAWASSLDFSLPPLPHDARRLYRLCVWRIRHRRQQSSPNDGWLCLRSLHDKYCTLASYRQRISP